MILLRLITARKVQGGGLDPDAQAFITAAGITDATQKSAIDTLVKDLKGYNIWSKMRAVYPFVGGTANTHKYNLKDPRDLDEAYRLSFNGTWVHDSFGADQIYNTPSYANTNILCNSLNSVDCSFGIYLRKDPSNVGYTYQMGAINDTTFASGIGFSSNPALSRYVFGITNSSGQGLVVLFNQVVFKGFFSMVSRSATDREYYRGNTSLYTDTNNVTPDFKPYPIILGTLYIDSDNPKPSPQWQGNSQYTFAYIATSGFSDSEITNLYTAVQTFQTTLGRQV